MADEFLRNADEKNIFLPDNKSSFVVDRILLYIKGLDIEPITGLEIALECLQQASDRNKNLNIQECMENLYYLLYIKKFDPESLYKYPPSTPVLNRRSMIAERLNSESAMRHILKRLMQIMRLAKQEDSNGLSAG